MRTRNQEYAIEAHKRVTAVLKRDGDRVYGTLSHKLPLLIRSAGLAQALAFVDARAKKNIEAEAKAENIHHRLLNDLAQTIGKKDKAELLNQARTVELADYMLLTQQVLAAL